MAVNSLMLVFIYRIHHKGETKDTNFGGYLFWDMICGTVLHPDHTDGKKAN